MAPRCREFKEGEIAGEEVIFASIRWLPAAAIVGLGYPSIASVSYPNGIFAARIALDDY